jgi:hypothetical protein
MLGELMQELRDSGCHTMVMSAEGISAPAWMPPDDVLEELARVFDLTTVCVLRRPDTFAESFWNHRCKTGDEKKDVVVFAGRPRMKRHSDYPALLAPWARVGALKVLGFEAIRKTGLVETFAESTGVPVRPDPKLFNVSPSMTCAAYMAVLNGLGLEARWQQVERALGEGGPRTALGRRLRRSILDEFAPMCERLEKLHGVTFPTDLPDEDEEPLALPSADAARAVREAALALPEKGRLKAAARGAGRRALGRPAG